MWIVRIASLFQKDRLDSELEKDIQEHLQMATEENIRRGMNPRQAANEARRSFGGVEQIKEEFRDQRGIPLWDSFSRETRFAIRSLRNKPAFALLAVLTLAVAIGANATIFSAVNVLLLHPSGVSEPNRLVVIRSRYEKLNVKNLVVSLSDFNQVSESSDVFSAAAIAKTANFTYIGGQYPQRLAALRVSWRWFETLGARPALGRLFTAEEDRPGRDHVVIVSFATWMRRFGGDSSIVGKFIRLDQQLYNVVGVMGPEFTLGVNELGRVSGQSHDIFVPLAAPKDSPPAIYTETYLSVARLQHRVSLAGATSFMSVLTNRGLQDPLAGKPREENGWGLFIVPYTEYAGGDLRMPLLILWGAVALVFLIACANISGLMMARMSARSRELAVRSALGASRWHLFRLILAESSVLALAGSILGLAVAYALIRIVEVDSPPELVGALRIPFNLPTIAFTAIAGILSCLIFGTLAAAHASSGNRMEAIKTGVRSGAVGPEKTRLRAILVSVELALAVVLSIGAGLLLRSLTRLYAVDVGFRPADVMTAVVTLPDSRYKEPASLRAFYQGVIKRLASLPGVKAAAAGYPIPFSGGFEERSFQVEGRPISKGPALTAQIRLTTPEFNDVLGIPVIRGRPFTEEDVERSEKVMLIDEVAARRFWRTEDPLGQRVVLRSGVQATIVGVVGHTKQSDLASDSDAPVFYYSLYQLPLPLSTLIVRASGALLPASAIREAVNSIDPAQSIYDVATMDQRVSGTLGARKFTVALLALFAIIAVFLAALGLYGVVNYGVTQRTQEIGIRMALGAQRSQVLNLILRGGIRLTLTGLLFGWLVAFSLARQIPDQLFGVNAFDPVVFVGMSVFMSVVALLASYLPARRATKLDPLQACRYE
jgi:putative ABC transport system permease protein